MKFIQKFYMVIVKIMKILVLLIEITINDIKDIKITNNVFLNKNVKKKKFY